MHTLFALVLTATAAVVIARPPGPVASTSAEDALSMPSRKYEKDYVEPRFLWPNYYNYDDNPPVPEPLPQPDPEPAIFSPEWLTREIARLNKQQSDDDLFQSEVPEEEPQPTFMKRILVASPYAGKSKVEPYYSKQAWPAWSMDPRESSEQESHNSNGNSNESYESAQESHEIAEPVNGPVTEPISNERKKKEFALTPLDPGYFEPNEKHEVAANMKLEGQHEGGGKPIRLPANTQERHPELEPEPPRQTRQNPNLSRTKSLVAENLGMLRAGLSGHDEAHRDTQHIHTSFMESADPETEESFYGVALISAVGAVVVMAVGGFAFGWYTLSKRAKAAADVDYPAYGVTGPTMDASSGDKKLAHSAHMYHYQHQKQQIIAMENSGMERRSSSVSDPESEEENEEGDYTVYECPGFATTGDMEVRNPLFTEDPTPATPGKCEIVKPQPKD